MTDTPKSGRVLSIQYAGICALVSFANDLGDEVRGEMWLVDVERTGRTPHFPVLCLDNNRWVEGSPGDLVIAPKAPQDVEQAVYMLKGSTISIKSDLGPQPYRPLVCNTPHSEFEIAPKDNRAGLEWIPNVTRLSGATRLKVEPPVACRVVDLAGRLTAVMTDSVPNFRVFFENGANRVPGMFNRFFYWRIEQELPFDKVAMIRIENRDGAREILIKEPARPQTVVISNGCQGPDQGPMDHFNSYYDLLEDVSYRPHARNEEVKPIGAHPDTDPDQCGNGRMVVKER
jgi:hypothetical protein